MKHLSKGSTKAVLVYRTQVQPSTVAYSGRCFLPLPKMSAITRETAPGTSRRSLLFEAFPTHLSPNPRQRWHTPNET